MATSTVLGKLEFCVEMPEEEVKSAILQILPDSDDAWERSALCLKTGGEKSPRFWLANCDPEETIVIIHSQGEQQKRSGKPVVTVVEVMIEPARGVPARKVAEEIWSRLSQARLLGNGHKMPQLVKAAVTSLPRQDILNGAPSNLHDVLWSPEFRMPAVSGLTAAVLLVGFGWWIPESQRPSAWWAIAPFLLYAVVAVVLARSLHKPHEEVSWTIV